MKHLENIQKSFTDLKSSPIILLPSIFLFISIFFMFILVVIQLAVVAFPFGEGDKYVYDQFVSNPDILSDILDSVNWGLFLVFLAIDIVLYYLIISYYRATHYGVINDITNRGNSSFERLLNHGRSYFLNMLSYSVAKALLTNGVLIVLLSIPLVLAGTSVIDSLSAVFLGIFLFLLWFLFVALPVSVVTLFAFPLVFDKKKGGFQILWESLTYSNKNFKHVLLTWLIVLLLGIAFQIIVLPIDIITTFLPPLAIVSVIISWVLGIVLNLYIFNSYLSKNKKKQTKRIPRKIK